MERKRTLQRFLIFTSAIMITILFGITASSSFEAVSTEENGDVAIQGYDTVAYFTENKPVKGEPAYDHMWQGARWLFANSRHRDLFVENPRKYAPRYGGFCSGAMVLGSKVRSDPQAWKIIDGKLYLNYEKAGMEQFALDADKNIPIADANWAKLNEPMN